MSNDLDEGDAVVDGPTEGIPTENDILEQSGVLLGMVSRVHDVPVDYDGCEITILRDPETRRIIAVILSPVDIYADEPFARYMVQPDSVVTQRKPKLALVT